MSSPPKLKVTGIKPIWQSPYKHETNINKSFESILVSFDLRIDFDWSILIGRFLVSELNDITKSWKSTDRSSIPAASSQLEFFELINHKSPSLEMSFLFGCQMSDTWLVDLKTVLNSREMQIRNKALIFDRHLDQDFHFYPDLLPPAPVFLRLNMVLLVPRSLLWLTIPDKATSQNHINIRRGSYSTISW